MVIRSRLIGVFLLYSAYNNIGHGIHFSSFWSGFYATIVIISIPVGIINLFLREIYQLRGKTLGEPKTQATRTKRTSFGR